ncbi:MAG: EscU/YscU/HrcU family type III secretion system export apparatus switch protein [Bryobacteraceae bacterium]|nr:EscU/YscU/HrcU family type III secretion system export apparatus switch protein [Bryobacteraceae bacterium]
MAPGERQEKATPRRIDRARKEGRFVSSRLLVGAVQFAVAAYLISGVSGERISALQARFRSAIASSFQVQELSVERFLEMARTVLVEDLAAWWVWGLAMMLAAVTMQSLTTQFGWATANLTPKFERLNPLSRIQQLPGENLSQLGQILLLLPVVAFVLFHLIQSNFGLLAATARSHPLAGAQVLGQLISELLRSAAFLFLLLGLIDYAREYRRYHDSLKMSKQEIKEEHKESEGRPEVKQRMRRLQREYSRRRMMADVEKATAVITNPTHYAVAIRFDFAEMAAPRVVAKGKNYLAKRIRERAAAHEVPLVENPPLAQALYRSVRVGDEIPAHLYKAVAEVLAYLYRLMGHRLPGGARS